MAVTGLCDRRHTAPDILRIHLGNPGASPTEIDYPVRPPCPQRLPFLRGRRGAPVLPAFAWGALRLHYDPAYGHLSGRRASVRRRWAAASAVRALRGSRQVD